MARADNKNRYLLAAVVAGLHIAVIVIVIEVQSQAPHPYTEPATAMRVRVFLTRSRRPRAFPAPAPPGQAPVIAPITPEIRGPGISPGPDGIHIEVPGVIDWTASARRAVAAILDRKANKSFGFPKSARAFRAANGSSGESMPHAGQSYRTRGGRRVAWVSKHCYLVSSPPPLGASQLQRQTRMSSIGCKASGGSAASQSFMERLRAYERYRRERLRRYKVTRPNHGP